MTELQKLILKALQHIAVNGPKENCLGICAAVSEYLDSIPETYSDDALDAELTMAMATWPNKSISDAYPVGNWSMQPSKLFWAHYYNGQSMWDPKTRYGKARLDLLQHTLAYFLKLGSQE